MNKQIYAFITLIGITTACATHTTSRSNDLGKQLLSAAEHGHESQVQLLLGTGAIVNHQSQFGDTPLLLAVIGGHISTVKLLLDNGAEANHQNQFSDTPLILAVIEGHISIVKLLLDHGAEVNHRGLYNDTPLILAVVEGHISIVKLLLDHGAEVNHQNMYNDTPLISAAEQRHISENHDAIVRLLLERGAHWPQNIQLQSVTSYKNSFNKRKSAIQTFFEKIDLGYNIPNDVSCILKRCADVPKQHGPLGTGCKRA